MKGIFNLTSLKLWLRTRWGVLIHWHLSFSRESIIRYKRLCGNQLRFSFLIGELNNVQRVFMSCLCAFGNLSRPWSRDCPLFIWCSAPHHLSCNLEWMLHRMISICILHFLSSFKGRPVVIGADTDYLRRGIFCYNRNFKEPYDSLVEKNKVYRCEVPHKPDKCCINSSFIVLLWIYFPLGRFDVHNSAKRKAPSFMTLRRSKTSYASQMRGFQSYSLTL